VLTGDEQRILVLGNSGSGKSTLTRQLSEVLGLPAVHLDAFFWQRGWIETPRAEWDARVPELCAGERWVQDGNYARSLPQRLRLADTVVLFDRPTVVCLWRVVRRWWQYRGVSRPDLAPGCPEKIDLEFMGWVVGFRFKELPRVHAALREAPTHPPVIVLRHDRDVEALLESARGGRSGAHDE
jgi:adenylate kinase family enzyme